MPEPVTLEEAIRGVLESHVGFAAKDYYRQKHDTEAARDLAQRIERSWIAMHDQGNGHREAVGLCAGRPTGEGAPRGRRGLPGRRDVNREEQIARLAQMLKETGDWAVERMEKGGRPQSDQEVATIFYDRGWRFSPGGASTEGDEP